MELTYVLWGSVGVIAVLFWLIHVYLDVFVTFAEDVNVQWGRDIPLGLIILLSGPIGLLIVLYLFVDGLRFVVPDDDDDDVDFDDIPY